MTEDNESRYYPFVASEFYIGIAIVLVCLWLGIVSGADAERSSAEKDMCASCGTMACK